MARFGRLLGSHLGPFGRPSWPQFGPKWASKCDLSKKVVFQKNERHCSHSTMLRSKSAPDGPKMGPRGSQEGFKNQLLGHHFSFKILVRFGVDLGCLLGALLRPFWVPKGVDFCSFLGCRPKKLPKHPQERPRAPQDRPKSDPRGAKRLPKTFLVPC